MVPPKFPQMNTLTPLELAQWMKDGVDFHLLDVREEEENRFASIPNSTLIPLNELTERLAELEPWKGSEMVVYCHHGIRSARAVQFLSSQGFTKVANLTGGIDRWSREVDSRVPIY